MLLIRFCMFNQPFCVFVFVAWLCEAVSIDCSKCMGHDMTVVSIAFKLHAQTAQHGFSFGSMLVAYTYFPEHGSSIEVLNF